MIKQKTEFDQPVPKDFQENILEEFPEFKIKKSTPRRKTVSRRNPRRRSTDYGGKNVEPGRWIYIIVKLHDNGIEEFIHPCTSFRRAKSHLLTNFGEIIKTLGWEVFSTKFQIKKMKAW